MLELLTAITIYCRISANQAEQLQCYKHFRDCARQVKNITFPAELFTKCDRGYFDGTVRPDIYIDPYYVTIQKPVYKVVDKVITIEKPVYKTKRRVIWRKEKPRKKPKRKPPKPKVEKRSKPIDALLDEQYGRRLR